MDSRIESYQSINQSINQSLNQSNDVKLFGIGLVMTLQRFLVNFNATVQCTVEEMHR